MNVKNEEELIIAIETAEKSGEKTVIYVKKGTYRIKEPISLKGNIEIVGEEGTVFMGSERISLKSAVNSNGIYAVDIPEGDYAFNLGPFKDYWACNMPKPYAEEMGPSVELFYEGKRMNMSRYPEEGFLRVEKALGETPIYFKKNEKNGSEEGIFIPSDIGIFEKNEIENMLLVGYWNADWAIQRHVIESFDESTGAVKVKEPYHTFGYRDGRCYSDETGGKFFVLNCLSEVKKPGDWYIDLKENKIYLIPYEGQKYIDITQCTNLFEAENAENIVIKNVEISQCKRSAIRFKDCRNVKIENCVMHDLGAWGAILENCYESSVSYSKVYNTAAGGIACSGGDRKTLTPSGNVINNNEIFDIAYWHKSYTAGIDMNGVCITASENYIHDALHMGITYHGNNHIVERNHIRNVCTESNDAGALYAGSDYASRGNIIRYNYLHELSGFENRGCLGLYFDDGNCSAEIYGNIIADMPYVAIAIGGGRNFDIHDNYIYNCKIAVMFDARLETWAKRNSFIAKRLDEVPYRSEIWKNAYPDLYNILEDEPTWPKYNKFYNNTVVGGDGIAMAMQEIEKYMERKNNKYIPLDYKTEYTEHLRDWYYVNENM